MRYVKKLNYKVGWTLESVMRLNLLERVIARLIITELRIDITSSAGSKLNIRITLDADIANRKNAYDKRSSLQTHITKT